jgi:hypothetical protein
MILRGFFQWNYENLFKNSNRYFQLIFILKPNLAGRARLSTQRKRAPIQTLPQPPRPLHSRSINQKQSRAQFNFPKRNPSHLST